MGELTRHIIHVLETKNLTNNQDDYDIISYAAELLCKRKFLNYTSSFPNVEEEESTDQEAEQLEQALVAALGRDLEEPSVIGSLICALSKTGNSQHKQLYQSWLQKCFRQLLSYNSAICQTLLALSDCEDEVTVLEWESDAHGYSFASLGSQDVEKNVRLAREYLKAVGMLPY